MAYTLNSARDSRGDERLYVQDFEKHRAQIEAYKRTQGGDYERAYRAVTGKPWPAGRSVKISNGRVEMTKDRTVKSVLGKFVAPAAAGVATAFGVPGLFPGLLTKGGARKTAPAGTAGAAATVVPSMPGTLARTAGATAGQLNPWLQATLAGLAGLPALMVANKGPSDEEKRLYEQARQMAELQQARATFQNPLFQSVTQLAMKRLPTNVQESLGSL